MAATKTPFFHCDVDRNQVHLLFKSRFFIQFYQHQTRHTHSHRMRVRMQRKNWAIWNSTQVKIQIEMRVVLSSCCFVFCFSSRALVLLIFSRARNVSRKLRCWLVFFYDFSVLLLLFAFSRRKTNKFMSTIACWTTWIERVSIQYICCCCCCFICSSLCLFGWFVRK